MAFLEKTASGVDQPGFLTGPLLRLLTQALRGSFTPGTANTIVWNISRVSLNCSHLHGLQQGALLLTTPGVRPFSTLASGHNLADYTGMVSG